MTSHEYESPEPPPSAQGDLGIGQRHHREPDSGERREHNTNSIACWCGPRLYEACDCESGCWKCENGLIALTNEQAFQAEFYGAPMVIVHNDDILSSDRRSRTP